MMALCSPSWSQGILPPKDSTSTVTAESDYPVRIGSKIPENLTVMDEQGRSRTLLSYKAALEILVVGFVTSDCPDEQAKWGKLRHFMNDYKDWKVAFVAVNAGPADSTFALKTRLDRAKLQLPIVQDGSIKLKDAFRIRTAPTLLIIDEGGYLRYRGPLGKPARTALEAQISHMNMVASPELPLTEGCSLP